MMAMAGVTFTWSPVMSRTMSTLSIGEPAGAVIAQPRRQGVCRVDVGGGRFTRQICRVQWGLAG